jgi:ABC-2 type transport system permease protein
MGVIYTIWLRNMKRYLRSRSRIIGSLGMPLFFLLILGFGLNSVVTGPHMGRGYVAFIVPGIVSMTVLFTSMFAGIQIIWDKQFGFLKETLVAPVPRLQIMLGQTLGGATTALIQGFIILMVSLLMGVRPVGAAGVALAMGYMILIGVGFTALGIAIASRLNDMHGFQLIMNFVIFPIFGLSGALFPIGGLPLWLRSLTLIDPLTYGVEGIRYGLTGAAQMSPLASAAALGAFTTAMVVLGAGLFRRVQI